jgi:CarD family transcriptional regulator
MAARKKVTKTAKSGGAAGAIRSKPDTARAKVSASKAGSKTHRASTPKTSAAVKPEKAPVAKPTQTVATQPVVKPKAVAKPTPAETKTEKATSKTVAGPVDVAPSKPESAAGPGFTVGKAETRTQGNLQNAQNLQSSKVQPERAELKTGDAATGAMKTTNVPAPGMAAKTAKPAPAPKTNERELSGGDQKTMKNSVNKHGFKLNEFVVYPAHGVGQIVAIEEQEVASFKLELFVINFAKDKMTLRVPVGKVTGVGMRKLSDPEQARRSLEILTGRARVKRTMWSRRAQEYEAKINSGDINAIAEVVRDLFRSEAQPEQSYSERQLYEAALDRMMREIAAVQKTTEAEALKVIDTQLKKNTKRGAKADPSDPAEADEAGIEEAA